MAEIPVQKKSGKTWLWVLLAIILAALLAWWLLNDDGDEDAYNDTVATATAPAPADQMAIGQSVGLENVNVGSLAGDMAFNADVGGQSMLVLFDQTPTPGTPIEGEYDINPGSVLNIRGEVRSASDPLPSGVEATIPSGTDRYIFAESIEMVR